MRRPILLLTAAAAVFCCPAFFFQLFSVSAFATTFYSTYRADSASTSTVKLIRYGQVFTDTDDVYTMVWNATTHLYEATLDDATFIEDYYRIENGASNIVIKYFALKNNVTDGDNVEDVFVRNNADDQITGELIVKPASATDSQLRFGTETDSSITLSAENAAKSADRILYVNATSFRFSDASQIRNLAPATASDHAVNKAQLDTLDSRVDSLDDRLDLLECAETFSSPACTLTARSRRNGISLSWNMTTTANDTSVCKYELYRGPAAVPGHAAGTINTTQLANIRSRMDRLSLGGLQDNGAFVSTDEGWYFIVVAFDGDYPINLCASSQIWADGGSALDETIPIVGGASNLTNAVSTLASKVDALDLALGSGNIPKILFCQNHFSATDTGTVSALTIWIDSTGVEITKIRGVFYKDQVYNYLRLRASCYVEDTGKPGFLFLYGGTLDTYVTETSEAATTRTLNLDLSTLDDGVYEWRVTLTANAPSYRIYLTDVIVELLAQ